MYQLSENKDKIEEYDCIRGKYNITTVSRCLVFNHKLLGSCGYDIDYPTTLGEFWAKSLLLSKILIFK